MELTIKVEIGVTKEVESLARAILSGNCRQTEQPPLAEVVETKRPAPAKKTEPKKTESAEVKTEEPKAEPKAKAEEPKKEVDKSTFTEEDIRQAMHECRTRIEGEDYKDNTDSEGYQKYHRNLTQWFKNRANLLGYEKPSALPEELRATFIDDCKNTLLAEDGSFYIKLPF